MRLYDSYAWTPEWRDLVSNWLCNPALTSASSCVSWISRGNLRIINLWDYSSNPHVLGVIRNFFRLDFHCHQFHSVLRWFVPQNILLTKTPFFVKQILSLDFDWTYLFSQPSIFLFLALDSLCQEISNDTNFVKFGHCLTLQSSVDCCCL